MAETAFTQLPKGFRIEERPDGCPAISYRTSGMRGVAIFLSVWLGFWFAASVFMTVMAHGDPWSVVSTVLIILGLWTIWFVVAGYAAWYFLSTTVFLFLPDRLSVERRLWRYKRKFDVERSGITAVRLVKDGAVGEDPDSFPSWGLEAVGQATTKLLCKQPIEKSDWLGPIVAEWAGVSYEPAPERM